MSQFSKEDPLFKRVSFLVSAPIVLDFFQIGLHVNVDLDELSPTVCLFERMQSFSMQINRFNLPAAASLSKCVRATRLGTARPLRSPLAAAQEERRARVEPAVTHAATRRVSPAKRLRKRFLLITRLFVNISQWSRCRKIGNSILYRMT